MAWVEHRVTRTSQPQELVGIDWSNPLTAGLQGAVGVYNGTSTPVVTGSPELVATREGLAYRWLDGGNNSARVPTPAFTGSNYTLLTAFTPRAAANTNFRKVGGWVAGIGGAFFNYDHGNPAYREAIELWAGGVTGVLKYPASAVGSLTVWAATVSGTSLTGYANGVLAGSSTATGTPNGWSAVSNGQAGGDPTSPVDGMLTLTWGRALSDAEIKSLSDNPWQIFEPHIEYVWVDDFVSTGTTPVDSDRLVNYLINTSSTTDLPLNYSIRTSAIQDAIFEYSLNSSLSSDRSATYNIRTSASSDDLNQYLIRTFANSDITSSFNTRTSAANDEVVNYLIRANAAADANYSFNTRTNAFSDAGYSYLIRNATQVDFSTLYNIFGPLASDLIQSYNIRSSLNTSSTYNFNIQNSIQSDEVNQYNIRTTASNTTAADYNIRTNAGTNLESLYEIINAGQVSQALNIQYNIRALSDNSFNSYYLIYSAVGQNVDAAYNIRTNTFKDIQFSYDITAGISTVTSDLTAMYNVLSTSSITQQDLINISTQVWNHSLTGDRTPGSSGSMLQDVSAREAAR